jgi:hypothetical protein
LDKNDYTSRKPESLKTTAIDFITVFKRTPGIMENLTNPNQNCPISFLNWSKGQERRGKERKMRHEELLSLL